MGSSYFPACHDLGKGDGGCDIYYIHARAVRVYNPAGLTDEAVHLGMYVEIAS